MKVKFYPVDENDWLSSGLYHVGGSPFLFPDLRELIHCSVLIGDNEFDFTLHGCSCISVHHPSYGDRHELASVEVVGDGLDQLLAQTRAIAIMRCNAKLSVCDLVRMGIGRLPHGLLCTGFVEHVLGLTVWNGTPKELYMRLTNNGTILTPRKLSELWQ